MCTPITSNYPGWICCRCVARNKHEQSACKKCLGLRNHGGIPLNDTERDLSTAYDEMFNGFMRVDEWIDIFVPDMTLAEFDSRVDDIRDQFEFFGFPADTFERVRRLLE